MEIHERRRRWLTPDALGFAAHWAWIWCVFWSNRFYDEGAALESLVLSPVSMLEPLWVLSLFSNVVAIAALLLVARVRNPLSELRSLSVVGTAVYQFGYQYFYLVLWAIWAVLAARENLPAAWVCAWGLLAIQIGQLAGSLAADLGLGFLVGDGALAMLSAAVIFATLIVSLFVFSGRSASTGWGSVRPMEEEARAAEGRTLEDACDALSRRSRLTVRETDVFCLLARGRNRAFICKELVIGDETVKSHVKAIYRKLNVHSQQELINLVEEERAEG